VVVIDCPYFSVYRDGVKNEGRAEEERKKRRKVDKTNGLREKNRWPKGCTHERYHFILYFNWSLHNRGAEHCNSSKYYSPG
jgi:hypothetical protein